VNDLFEGDLTDDDRLVYVNNVIKGKLLESQELVTQTNNNTKAQFANSPTLSREIMNAVMDALDAHTTMSKQAIDSEKVREGLNPRRRCCCRGHVLPAARKRRHAGRRRHLSPKRQRQDKARPCRRYNRRHWPQRRDRTAPGRARDRPGSHGCGVDRRYSCRRDRRRTIVARLPQQWRSADVSAPVATNADDKALNSP
jgi:hypothetical protein